jgi:CheY-like chemotaxis protein/pSer/pThr/pTyr-binding forkhead associated (FHA) protein
MTETSTAPWIIELHNMQMPAPKRLRIDEEVIIGRIVQGDPKPPDLDLTPYGAEELGVSRLHVSVCPDEDRLSVTDLDSNNGTFLNGNRLKSDEKYYLKNGDQLQLGRMRLDVKVIISPAYSGSIHRQPSLQLQDQVIAGKGQLVLIVEKGMEVAQALATIMERAGYATRIAHEVVGAIRNYNQRRPNAIIIDPLLPDMSGLEFCRYVRRDVMQNSMPVIVINSTERELDAIQVMQIGADILLEKPISARELRHVVSSLLYQHEIGGSAMYTKHLVGTAPLKAVPPDTRRNACVLFVAGYSDAPIVLTMQHPVTFGRAAGTGGLKAHIDLSRYEATNSGVSRIHMTLHYRDNHFYVEDMESVNGTYLNGDPIQPRTMIQLKNADEIRLGQLRLYIYFLTDTGTVSGDQSDDKSE